MEPVRRLLLALTVAVLAAEAAGLASLMVPEQCASVADQAQDNDCPATCARCACAQPVVAARVVDAAAAVAPLAPVADVFAPPLLTGSPRDVLHVPKAASLL